MQEHLPSKERFKITPAVYLIIFNTNNEILLQRRANTGYEDGNYSLPAGHKEMGEYPTEAMAREAKEEIDIIVDPADLVCVHIMMRIRQTASERVDQFFIATKYSGTPKIMEPDKCDDLSFFPIDNLPGNIIPYVKHALECYKAGIIYSEYGK